MKPPMFAQWQWTGCGRSGAPGASAPGPAGEGGGAGGGPAPLPCIEGGPARAGRSRGEGVTSCCVCAGPPHRLLWAVSQTLITPSINLLPPQTQTARMNARVTEAARPAHHQVMLAVPASPSPSEGSAVSSLPAARPATPCSPARSPDTRACSAAGYPDILT